MTKLVAGCGWRGYNVRYDDAQPVWGRCFMSDAFISYRRKPSALQASLLQEKLKNRHNIVMYNT